LNPGKAVASRRCSKKIEQLAAVTHGTFAMQTVGQLLRERRQALDLSLAHVAERIGVARSYLSMIENHRVSNPPSAALLQALEQALGFEPETLRHAAAWQNTPATVKAQFDHVQATAQQGQALAHWLKQATTQRDSGGKNLDRLYRTGQLGRRVNALLDDTAGPVEGLQPLGVKRHRVPLINQVAAGYPTGFTDLDYPARIADEYLECPDLSDPDAFAARVVGDSMQPDYREGDIVVFSPQADVTDGCDCFARLEPDHETTFKRVFFEGDPGAERIRLQPINPKFPPRTLPREDVAGLYRAVWKMSRL
jgi:SOS-response transcriptional repressor LexA